MVVQTQEPPHQNREGLRKFLDSFFNPKLAVAGPLAEQKRSPHAPRDAVIPASHRGVDQARASHRHRSVSSRSPPKLANSIRAVKTQVHVLTGVSKLPPHASRDSVTPESHRRVDQARASHRHRSVSSRSPPTLASANRGVRAQMPVLLVPPSCYDFLRPHRLAPYGRQGNVRSAAMLRRSLKLLYMLTMSGSFLETVRATRNSIEAS